MGNLLQMKILGFGIIGAGLVAPMHIEAIENTEGARLAAISDAIEERAAKIGSEKGVAWYADYRRMLENPDVDVVCICTPSGLRGQIAIDAAAAGKHVISEKPLELTPEKADVVIKACDDAGVKLAVIMQMRFLDDPQALKKDVEDGRLGRLILGDAYTKWHRPQSYYDNSQWRGTWALDGGGALINQGIHHVDMLQWIMGPVESLCAHTGTIIRDIEVEDTAVACLKFASGAMGVIEASTSCWPGMPGKLEIRGENGLWVIEDGRTKLRSIRDEEDRGSDAPGIGSGANDPTGITSLGHQRQIADMVAAVNEDRPPMVDGREGRKAIEIICAIYKSAQTGAPVVLNQLAGVPDSDCLR